MENLTLTADFTEDELAQLIDNFDVCVIEESLVY
jgi:hypothetical protein